MLRIEVGPREAQQNCCTIARCFEAGVPAMRIEGVAVDANELPRRADDLAKMDQEEAAASVAAFKSSAQARTAERAKRLRDEAGISEGQGRSQVGTHSIKKPTVKIVKF